MNTTLLFVEVFIAGVQGLVWVVLLTLNDGSEQAFTVSTVELVPKPAVSFNGVFARDGERLLRLVTCGGEFEEAARSYRSNVIVTAVPA
jgi:hypothetical protein